MQNFTLFNRLVVLSVACLGLALGACTSPQLNKNLDAKIAAEPTPDTRASLEAQSKKLIDAEKLPPEKAAQLKALSEQTHNDYQVLLQESLKLRSVLIKDVINDKYDDEEVLLIKARMKDLEQKKLDLIFRTVGQANRILGHETIHQKDREFMMMNLMDGTPLYRNGF